MRLSDEGFWGITLRQFMLLLDRRNAQIKREDRNLAEVLAAIYNTVRDPKKRPLTGKDFMPSEKRRKVQTPEEMLSVVKAMHRAFGGEVIK